MTNTLGITLTKVDVNIVGRQTDRLQFYKSEWKTPQILGFSLWGGGTTQYQEQKKKTWHSARQGPCNFLAMNLKLETKTSHSTKPDYDIRFHSPYIML
jgi:hypothetical protein